LSCKEKNKPIPTWTDTSEDPLSLYIERLSREGVLKRNSKVAIIIQAGEEELEQYN